MRITPDNIKENLKVGDFVKVNDSKYSKVTYLYWESCTENDLGFKVKNNICENTNIIADHNVWDKDCYIEKFQT